MIPADVLPGAREVALGNGRTLTIRRAAREDLDGLARLIEGLPQEDIRFRFFTLYHPPQSFYRDLISLNERGGCALIAQVIPEAGIVGAAEYALLEDGGGEFAMTVAPSWRGWLGPYLLDALVDVARLSGVSNLQADVLAENHRMLALLRRRGYLRMANDDVSVIRAAIATTSCVPTWRTQSRSPLILVENSGGSWTGEKQALQAQWRVIECSWGHKEGSPSCPVMKGRPCPLAESADAILVAPPAAAQTALLEAHQMVHPGQAAIAAAGNADEQLVALTTALSTGRTRRLAGAFDAGI